MDNIISKINLIYHSSNRKQYILVSSFFNIIGTFVQENIIDFSKVQLVNNVNANIVLLSKEFSSSLEEIKPNEKNLVCLIFTNTTNKIINYKIDTDKDIENFLEKIVFTILESLNISSSEKQLLREKFKRLISIYIQNKIYVYLTILGFFYKNSTFTQNIIQSLNNFVMQFKNCEYYHECYAMTKIAYELNDFLRRNKKPLIFDNFEIEYILANLHSNDRIIGSSRVLNGELRERLFSDPSEGRKYYKECLELNPNHYYASYKYGLYCQNWLKLYDIAIKYYNKVLALKPNYFQASYYIAKCLYSIDKDEDAIKVYKNLTHNLLNRYMNDFHEVGYTNILSPRELVCLYYSLLDLAHEALYGKRDWDEVQKYDRMLLDLHDHWIEQSKFLPIFLDENQTNKINDIIKESLDVEYIRTRLKSRY